MSPSDPAQVGRRVVVRYRRPEGSQPPLTDVVGVVTASDESAVTVDGTRGTITVRRDDVVVVKAVPPAPVRRGRPHRAVGTPDLTRLMADGWRAVEEEWEGDWLLRASSGFTTRGNSVLPLGDPGIDLDDAFERAEEWYALRGLPSRFQVVLPPGRDPADDGFGSELLARGYRLAQPTLVMTGAASDVEPLHAGAAVTVEATLSPSWLQAYARQRPVVPGVTEQVLTGSAGQLFLSTTGREGGITAVARMSVHPGWAGLSAVWVDPDRRGNGLGRTLLHAVGMLARQRRLPSVFLQVEVENDVAVGLYESEGFREHHAYGYLVREVAGSER
jgi:GNAT superfamily N-acetyltransferase